MDPVRAALEKLDPTHRDALVVLALAAERYVSRSAWQELVRDGGIVDERGRSPLARRHGAFDDRRAHRSNLDRAVERLWSSARQLGHSGRVSASRDDELAALRATARPVRRPRQGRVNLAQAIPRASRSSETARRRRLRARATTAPTRR